MSFTSELKKSAPAYLYAFISKDAKLGSAIMGKRTKQLNDLIAMSKIPLTPSLDEIISIVRQGIVEKYNRTPEQVLTILYYNNVNKVSGIGTVTGSHFDGTNWVDDATGEIICESESVLNTQEAANDGSGETKTFWQTCAGVIEWIVGILQSLGLTKNSEKASTYIPKSTDWATVPTTNTQSAGFGTIGYVALGLLALGMFTGGGKKSKKKSKE